jgi:hypothetical protein
MGLVGRIFGQLAADRFERKAEEALKANQIEDAVEFYRKSQSEYRELNKTDAYYHSNIETIYEKIANAFWKGARDNSLSTYQRETYYEEAFQNFQKRGRAWGKEAALEHCGLTRKLETIRFYREYFYSRTFRDNWQQFLRDLGSLAKKQASIKELGRTLLAEIISSETYISMSTVTHFIQGIGTTDLHLAELYLQAAEETSISSLDRSTLYASAAKHFLACGEKERWLECLVNKHIQYFEKWDINYTFSNINGPVGEDSEPDFHEILRNMGKMGLKEFFHEVMQAYFSDSRLTFDDLYSADCWPIFCEALIERVDRKGGDSLNKVSKYAVFRFIEQGIKFSPELGMKLAELIGIDKYGMEELRKLLSEKK